MQLYTAEYTMLKLKLKQGYMKR